MIPFIAAAGRVLTTSTRAASLKGVQSAASKGKSVSGATVESKAIDKFVKLNEKLSKTNRKDNRDNLNYINKMERSMRNMQRSMDSISKSSKSFMNNMKMLVGFGGIGGMLYTFLKITESYGSPQAKFRGKVTSTSLKDQKAFEQMLAVKGISKPDLLDRLGMAATEGSVVGTRANKFFAKSGINYQQFLNENSAGRLDIVLKQWDKIKHLPSISAMYEEFLGSSWAEINAMRNIGDLKNVYNQKYGALKDTNLNKFAKLHESLENIKQDILNKLVKAFEKMSPLIERISKLLGDIFLRKLDKINSYLSNMDDKDIVNKIENLFESIINGIEGLIEFLDKLDRFLDTYGIKSRFAENKETSDALFISDSKANRYFRESLQKSKGKYTDSLGKDAEVLRINQAKIDSALNVARWKITQGVPGFLGIGSSIYNFFKGNKAYEKKASYDYVAGKYNVMKKIVDEKVRKMEMTKKEADAALAATAVKALDELISVKSAYAYRKRNLDETEKNYLYQELLKSKDPEQTVKIFINNGDINQQTSSYQSNKK